MVSSMALEKEYQYYKAHKAELDTKYNGKFIVIFGDTILAAFPTHDQALEAALAQYDAGTFLIQHCVAGQDQSLHFFSRVSFARNA